MDARNSIHYLFDEDQDDLMHFNKQEIKHNLDQIESLISLIKSKGAFFVFKLEKLFSILKELFKDLIELDTGDGNKSICDENEILFLKFLILKRINYFNEMFNLNKKQIMVNSLNERYFMKQTQSKDPIQNTSVLNCANEYELFDKFEKGLDTSSSEDSLFKLIIKSVVLNHKLTTKQYKNNSYSFFCCESRRPLQQKMAEQIS